MVQTASLHEEVVGRIRDMIVEGELLAGSHVTERAICEKLGISRTPLREAYKVLAAEGLLTLLPNRGVVVSRLTQQDVEDILEMIALLEGMAVDRLCARASEDEIAAIERLHGEMVEHFRRGERLEYFKANQAVHEAIVAAARSPQLAKVHRGLGARVRRFRFAGNVDPARWERAVREHEQILLAIKDRDAHLLQALIRTHLRNGWKIVRRQNRDELAPPLEVEPVPEPIGRRRRRKAEIA